MGKKSKIGRNSPCPCGSGKKYKKCCLGSVDWNDVREQGDFIDNLSVRGRNKLFIARLGEILFEKPSRIPTDLKSYKKSFTSDAVAEINETILEIWPPNTDIQKALSKSQEEVSGLYVGDYHPEYILKGLVRHSIYATKILIVDPFIYPLSVRDDFNPILHPDDYLSQTLRNVNFWFQLWPWIKEGIVEIIRTPGDFDKQLLWDSMIAQEKKFKDNEALNQAANESVHEIMKRHSSEMAFRLSVLSIPDSRLENFYDQTKLKEIGIEFTEFEKYIEEKRNSNPDFLKPLGVSEGSGEVMMFTTGANHTIASITAKMTGSYIVTDMLSKWKEIEYDYDNYATKNSHWSPFAKAWQNLELQFLNNVNLEHALNLRKEDRLGGLRVFLRKVWKAARTSEPFNESNVQLLAEELEYEIKLAEEEWKQIDRDLIKMVGGVASLGAVSAGPMIASGFGAFLGGGIIVSGAATLIAKILQRKGFSNKFPAAFFMNLNN